MESEAQKQIHCKLQKTNALHWFLYATVKIQKLLKAQCLLLSDAILCRRNNMIQRNLIVIYVFGPKFKLV